MLEFSKVAGYKNQHTKLLCLYTHNEISNKDIKKTVPLASIKITLYFYILTKEVKDMYTKNYKALIKENEDTYKLIRRVNIVKMSTLPKAFYRFNAIPMITFCYFSTPK